MRNNKEKNYDISARNRATEWDTEKQKERIYHMEMRNNKEKTKTYERETAMKWKIKLKEKITWDSGKWKRVIIDGA